MGVLNASASVSCLLCFVCMLHLLLANELAHFDKNTTIDFKKLKVLADIGQLTDKFHTSDDYRTRTTGDDIITPDYNPTVMQEASTGLTVASYDETVRLGRLMDTDDSTVPDSTKAVREMETILPTTKSSDRMSLESRSPDLDHYSMETPPKIVRPLIQDRIIVLEQERPFKIVQCVADGNPEPTFKWLRNGAPIVNNEHIKSYSNGSIAFIDFSDREEGLYQCFATNKLGTSVSVIVPIVNEKVPSIVSSEGLTKRFEGTEGDPMSLECVNTPPTVPEYTKRWYYKIGSIQLPIDNRIGADSKGVLRFAYLEVNDTREYSCALVPAVALDLTSIRFYDSVVLNVKKRQNIPSSLKLAYASTLVKALLGSNATLECFFSGFPIPRITWKKSSSDELIQQGNSKYVISKDDHGRKLIIVNVQEEDDDSYICTASNGEGTQLVTMAVNVTSPPQKIPNRGINTLITPDGGDQVLMCKAKAVDPQSLSIPQWYRNGEPFNENNLPFPERYSFNNDMTELKIRSLNKEQDTSCFQCNVSNSEGYLFYDGYLRVIQSIKIDRWPHNMVIANTSSVDISVHASGDSCCKIKKLWFLNGVQLSSKILQAAPYQWGDDGNSLRFDANTVDYETLKSRVGNYLVRVYNDHEGRNVTFRLSLNNTESNPEPLIEAKEAGMQLWWIGIIGGILLIIIAIVVIVIFIKINYPGDTYLLEKAEIKHHLNPEKDLLDQSFQEV